MHWVQRKPRGEGQRSFGDMQYKLSFKDKEDINYTSSGQIAVRALKDVQEQ